MNLVPLLPAQGGELESVFCSEISGHFGGDDEFNFIQQWNLERGQFTDNQFHAHESSQAAFAQVAGPAMGQTRFLSRTTSIFTRASN